MNLAYRSRTPFHQAFSFGQWIIPRWDQTFDSLHTLCAVGSSVLPTPGLLWFPLSPVQDCLVFCRLSLPSSEGLVVSPFTVLCCVLSIQFWLFPRNWVCHLLTHDSEPCWVARCWQISGFWNGTSLQPLLCRTHTARSPTNLHSSWHLLTIFLCVSVLGESYLVIHYYSRSSEGYTQLARTLQN